MMCYFPAVLSAVIVGFIWGLIYDYHYGLVNTILRLLGMADKAQAWLNNDALVLPLVAIPLIWQYIGYYMIIIMSAISSVDHRFLRWQRLMVHLDGKEQSILRCH